VTAASGPCVSVDDIDGNGRKLAAIRICALAKRVAIESVDDIDGNGCAWLAKGVGRIIIGAFAGGAITRGAAGSAAYTSCVGTFTQVKAMTARRILVRAKL
jgi:hypothetical protein